MMRTCLLFLGGVMILGAVQSPAADETRPFSVHDMLAMERVSDWQVSPDGRLAVFGVSTTDLDANRRRNRLWLVETDGAGLKPLTSAAGGDAHPRWSPDGRSVLFLSSRSGSSQIWRIAVDGGEAEQFTRLPLDVGSFAVSPDGRLLALSMEVFPDGDTLASTVERLDAEKARKSSGRVYEQLMIRHWDTWRDGRRSHLFVLPLVGGDAIDLMRGMDADSPSKPFGGAEEYTFTPDSTGVVFTAKDDGRAEAWTTNCDLWHVPVDGSAAPRRLTADNLAWDTHPVFSPDGKTLAYLAMSRPGYESDRLRIVLRQWPNGPSRVLADDWDRSPEDIVWSADGRTIYATAANLGQVSLFAVDVASGSVRTIVEQGRVRGPRIAGGKLLFGIDDLQSPVELYTAATDGSQRQQITRINAGNVARAKMGDAEQFAFPGWNGETVYAYVVKPVDFDPAKKYPVAFLIHGGPQGSFGNTFHYRWNPQVYAGRGYASVMVDFHGSVGYGQAFTDSIGGDWGGKPLVDLQKGLAAALERYPWMDGDRVGALGASYGGYMINWIAGQWPDRFRCLVSHDGNLDERAAYFMTEELWFPEWEHRGTPWDNPAGYAKHNPVDHVDKWQTPMLVIHGALDFRVVETAGMATFTALQRRGIPSKFLYFPDENHWVLKPHNSIQWHDTVLDWLDQWLQPTTPQQER
jgi:dipeptidyl aminopeptidase/acylaminoacyl peptidase